MKNIFLKLFFIFFYCNFFIALCAASLIYETGFLLHLIPGYDWYALLIFCCVLNIYTFHYYLKSRKINTDKRLQWYVENRVLILSLLISVSFLITYLIISHFNLLFSKSNIFWSLLIPVLSIAYSFPFLSGGKALRHFGWLKLPLLSFVWSFATVVLPVFYSEKSNMNLSQVLSLFANRFFFIMALAMLFNVRDYEEDKKDKVVTPAVAFGPQKILFYGKGLMIFINIITGLLVCRYFNLHFTLQYIAVIIPVLFLFLLFHFFRFSRNEIEFSILHDGLIPVKALLLIFAASI